MTNGVKTTEFWVTLVQALVGPIVMVLVAAGIFMPETDQAAVSETINTNLSSGIQAVLAIIAQITSVSAVKNYTAARTDLKATTATETKQE